jgi:hypothetical protein
MSPVTRSPGPYPKAPRPKKVSAKTAVTSGGTEPSEETRPNDHRATQSFWQAGLRPLCRRLWQVANIRARLVNILGMFFGKWAMGAIYYLDHFAQVIGAVKHRYQSVEKSCFQLKGSGLSQMAKAAD